MISERLLYLPFRMNMETGVKFLSWVIHPSKAYKKTVVQYILITVPTIKFQIQISNPGHEPR